MEDTLAIVVRADIELDAPRRSAATGDVAAPLYKWPEPAPSALAGPTRGALQGDTYPIMLDENGFPELPACLDRKRSIMAEAA
jgi:hypothetical protein